MHTPYEPWAPTVGEPGSFPAASVTALSLYRFRSEPPVPKSDLARANRSWISVLSMTCVRPAGLTVKALGCLLHNATHTRTHTCTHVTHLNPPVTPT